MRHLPACAPEEGHRCALSGAEGSNSQQGTCSATGSPPARAAVVPPNTLPVELSLCQDPTSRLWRTSLTEPQVDSRQPGLLFSQQDLQRSSLEARDGSRDRPPTLALT
ncbi:UNVERIFIED_CONTAM: hypothetical protein K2H54_002038 [Gekko kuhli]